MFTMTTLALSPEVLSKPTFKAYQVGLWKKQPTLQQNKWMPIHFSGKVADITFNRVAWEHAATTPSVGLHPSQLNVEPVSGVQ